MGGISTLAVIPMAKSRSLCSGEASGGKPVPSCWRGSIRLPGRAGDCRLTDSSRCGAQGWHRPGCSGELSCSHFNQLPNRPLLSAQCLASMWHFDSAIPRPLHPRDSCERESKRKRKAKRRNGTLRSGIAAGTSNQKVHDTARNTNTRMEYSLSLPRLQLD